MFRVSCDEDFLKHTCTKCNVTREFTWEIDLYATLELYLVLVFAYSGTRNYSCDTNFVLHMLFINRNKTALLYLTAMTVY